MYVDRILQLSDLMRKKSHFLWGPRQTGKSSLVKRQLAGIRVINLLESDTFAELSARPSLLRERVTHNECVCIDEIQRLPVLLDEVHWLIEERSVKFLLTGSSARKLKRTAANLLGGRARSRFLFPLCFAELKKNFDLNTALNRGLLPSIYLSDDADDDLKSYVGDYLTQEIAAEAAVRNIPAFSRFLQTVSHCNAKQVNFEKLASDAQVAPSTVRGYFAILQETLLGHVLQPWKKGRKEVATPKFYLFDTGVARSLQGRVLLTPHTPEWGDAFEALIHHELCCYQSYVQRDATIHFWRTRFGREVDFILNDAFAIEVKGTRAVTEHDLKGLRELSRLYPLKRLMVVCQERHARRLETIEILPYDVFLGALWAGEFASP